MEPNLAGLETICEKGPGPEFPWERGEIYIYMNMHTYMYVLVHMCVYIINNKINICPF